MRNEDPFADYRDESGFTGPLPASDGQRRIPAAGFASDARFGPKAGDAFPGFRLRSSLGGWLDLHEDRGGSKAAVVFFRSAVW